MAVTKHRGMPPAKTPTEQSGGENVRIRSPGDTLPPAEAISLRAALRHPGQPTVSLQQLRDAIDVGRRR